MRRQLRTVAAALALVGLLSGVFTVPVVAAPADWVVDDDRVQCAKADFASIAEAMADEQVADGDIVRVCPGTYSDSVTISKSITLKGDPEAIDAIDCFSLNLPLDPAVHAIVDPASRAFGDAGQFGLKLRADGINVSGLVFQDGWLGIDASDEYSGYRISHNLFRKFAYFGVELGSNGQAESRVDHNCFWENAAGPGEMGGGMGSELDDPYLNISVPANRTLANARSLTNARIDHNRTYRNNEALSGFGPGLRDHVVFDHNLQRDDRFAIALQHSVSSAILDNDIAGPDLFPPRPTNFVSPILIGGANEGLEIAGNLIVGGRASVTFSITGGLDVFLEPSRDLVVRENTFTGATRSAIGTAPLTQGVAAVVDSRFEANIMSGNGFHGAILQSGVTGNTFVGNVADGNGGSGIFVRAGAGGNAFVGNSMHGNGLATNEVPPLLTRPFADARDDSGPANDWTDNSCATDSPAGELCDMP